MEMSHAKRSYETNAFKISFIHTFLSFYGTYGRVFRELRESGAGTYDRIRDVSSVQAFRSKHISEKSGAEIYEFLITELFFLLF